MVILHLHFIYGATTSITETHAVSVMHWRKFQPVNDWGHTHDLYTALQQIVKKLNHS